MAVGKVSDSTFDQEVLKASGPVVVDFWAEWCGPCKMIAPLLEEISTNLGDKVKIVKLNVDENNATAIKYDIKSIPTLMIFKDGERCLAPDRRSAEAEARAVDHILGVGDRRFGIEDCVLDAGTALETVARRPANAGRCVHAGGVPFAASTAPAK